MQTKEQAVEKTNEQLDYAIEKARVLVTKALNSGAINLELYDDDYRLPSIVTYAVLKVLAEMATPLSKADARASKNLTLFL